MKKLIFSCFPCGLLILVAPAFTLLSQSLQQFDFGDAPEGPYPTTLKQNGARHLVQPGFRLGPFLDSEPDGQPNSAATGDGSLANTPDDEDGVFFAGPLNPGSIGEVEVSASDKGQLDAWIDFNRNGSWADEGEQIFVNVPLTPGLNNLIFILPATAQSGRTFARFRLSRQGGLKFDGPAPDGEVEDYALSVSRPGCEQDTKGTDFWLTFPGNYAPDPDNPVRLRLCIIGNRATTGNVSIPGLGFSVNFVIPPSMEVMVTLPKAADLGASNELVEKKGIHVTASAPVGVFGLNHVSYTTDGYVGFPSGTLGAEYIVQGFANVHSGVPRLNGTQFAMVACENETKVTIIPSVRVGTHLPNLPFEVKLQQGETYQLRGTNDAPMDLSGTRILANKKVAVFGGHHCANIESSSIIFCDYLVEQLPPVSAFGTEFVTMPLATRLNGDTFRFLAAEDGTTVFVNGAPVAFVNAARSEQTIIIGPAHITSDRPILLTQYANSADYDNLVNADPLMVITPHVGQFMTRHMVCVPPEEYGFGANYLTIVAPTGVVSSVSLNGTPLLPGIFTVIGSSEFAGARIPVPPGAHNLSAPQPFSVIAYGWSEYNAYGWPSGFLFRDTTPPTITCPPNVTVTAGTAGIAANLPCAAFVPDLRQQVKIEDDCAPGQGTITQKPEPGTVVGVGTHPITFTATDAQGNRGECVTLLTVVAQGQTVLQCPQNIVARCNDPKGAKVFYEAFAQTACGDRIELECNPPPGTIFPPGVTEVVCISKDPANFEICTFTVRVDCRQVGISLTRGQVVIEWSGNQILEQAPTVAGPWTVVPNARSPFTPVLGNSQLFFRVRDP